MGKENERNEDMSQRAKIWQRRRTCKVALLLIVGLLLFHLFFKASSIGIIDREELILTTASDIVEVLCVAFCKTRLQKRFFPKNTLRRLNNENRNFRKEVSSQRLGRGRSMNDKGQQKEDRSLLAKPTTDL